MKTEYQPKPNAIRKSPDIKLPLKIRVKIGLGHLANNKMGGTFETAQNFDRLGEIEKELASAMEALNNFHSNEGDNVFRSGGGTTTVKSRDYWEEIVSNLEVEKKALQVKLGIANEN